MPPGTISTLLLAAQGEFYFRIDDDSDNNDDTTTTTITETVKNDLTIVGKALVDVMESDDTKQEDESSWYNFDDSTAAAADAASETTTTTTKEEVATANAEVVVEEEPVSSSASSSSSSTTTTTTVSEDELYAITGLAKMDPKPLFEFLKKRLDQMPPNTIQVLQMAAADGSTFPPGTTLQQQNDLELVGRAVSIILNNNNNDSDDGEESSSTTTTTTTTTAAEEASSSSSSSGESESTTTTATTSSAATTTMTGVETSEQLLDDATTAATDDDDDNSQTDWATPSAEIEDAIVDLENGKETPVLVSSVQEEEDNNDDDDNDNSSSSSSLLAELVPLSSEELGAISKIAKQDAASITSFLIGALPKMPENTLLALQLASSSETNGNIYSMGVSDEQRKDLTRVGTALRELIRSAKPAAASATAATNNDDDAESSSPPEYSSVVASVGEKEAEEEEQQSNEPASSSSSSNTNESSLEAAVVEQEEEETTQSTTSTTEEEEEEEEEQPNYNLPEPLDVLDEIISFKKKEEEQQSNEPASSSSSSNTNESSLEAAVVVEEEKEEKEEEETTQPTTSTTEEEEEEEEEQPNYNNLPEPLDVLDEIISLQKNVENDFLFAERKAAADGSTTNMPAYSGFGTQYSSVIGGGGSGSDQEVDNDNNDDDNDTKLAGLVPLSTEELDAISNMAQQDPTTLSSILIDALPYMPDNTILALQLAVEGKFSRQGLLSNQQKRDLETLGKGLSNLISNSKPAGNTEMSSQSAGAEYKKEEQQQQRQPEEVLSSEELDAISSIAQQDPSGIYSFLVSQLSLIPPTTITALQLAANNEFPHYVTEQQTNDLRTVGRVLYTILEDDQPPQQRQHSSSSSSSEEEETMISAGSSMSSYGEDVPSSSTTSSSSSSSSTYKSGTREDVFSVPTPQEPPPPPPPVAQVVQRTTGNYNTDDYLNDEATREVATAKDHPGVGLLNMLLITSEETIRSERLRYYLYPSFIGENNYALVKPHEFANAIKYAVHQINSQFSFDVDPKAAMSSLLRIAKEARLTIAQGYGEESEEFQRF
eukprot:CAMPEP_0194261512 /NCGR_PEP_ID=MMETSP0158-20130606/46063_1 /TAXON_ID=33649 /ORGANISM="Thalassionema nitzschioides, Strain L26-B" /LENGTH=1052 /DNA_ID=CAMNT_0039001635 /DNA_START=415 /DNA_END=3571 /DNA_ORIENTATION=+